MFKFLKKLFSNKYCGGCTANMEEKDNTIYYTEHCNKCNKTVCFEKHISWSDQITCLCCGHSETITKIIN